MKLYVNNQLLGETSGSEGPPIGGMSGSTSVAVQVARFATRTAIIDRGSPTADITVPVIRQFGSPREAEEWLIDFLKVGRVTGTTRLESHQGKSQTWERGIATLSGFGLMGAAIKLTWRVQLGDALD